ncbi:hypothetical protein QBC38DRAFT_259498 [Podospora fimiseda]|uniref:Uncharacterized protein n=1 Tax=Podospora fimiseda TaxID=252190 RepID=A0AAN7BWV5_9PEZI|nr:hypothetical protein QBC38DRAFT_259498 [Podospora fimiseda]
MRFHLYYYQSTSLYPQLSSLKMSAMIDILLFAMAADDYPYQSGDSDWQELVALCGWLAPFWILIFVFWLAIAIRGLTERRGARGAATRERMARRGRPVWAFDGVVVAKDEGDFV